MLQFINDEYACEVCDYDSKSKSDMRKHKETIHTDIFLYCVECDREFNSQTRLKTHTERHHTIHDNNSEARSTNKNKNRNENESVLGPLQQKKSKLPNSIRVSFSPTTEEVSMKRMSGASKFFHY